MEWSGMETGGGGRPKLCTVFFFFLLVPSTENYRSQHTHTYTHTQTYTHTHRQTEHCPVLSLLWRHNRMDEGKKKRNVFVVVVVTYGWIDTRYQYQYLLRVATVPLLTSRSPPAVVDENSHLEWPLQWFVVLLSLHP